MQASDTSGTEQSKFISAEQIAALVKSHATIAVTGSGGGLLEPDEILGAIERRFLATGEPRNLTVLHAQGLGDGDGRGLNHLAHPGLVKRVIGAHWTWSPRMQALAASEQIEAYAFPGGAIQHLIREIGAGRPGLITPIGLDTMVDPRSGGGRMNACAEEALNEIITVDGRDYIRYKPFKIDVAILRGSVSDPSGNTSFVEEGAELDALVLAMAAHNCGGKVLVQVRAAAQLGELAARSARLPGAMVDAVLIAPYQPQSYGAQYDVRLTGSVPPGFRTESLNDPAGLTGWERRLIGIRAFRELRSNSVVSFGFGIPDEVAKLAARSTTLRCYSTVDHGHYGGHSLQGVLFGFVRDGEAMIDSPSQFDFYSGGGIDVAFLGFGEFDGNGDVNVSKLGGKIIGPGGFIDITQGSRKVVFCGTFEAKGLEVSVVAGSLRIIRPGHVVKLVNKVEQVTFSAKRARECGQEVLFVTERAVFKLVEKGVSLEEIASGVDLQRDVLDRIGFVPIIEPGFPRVIQV